MKYRFNLNPIVILIAIMAFLIFAPVISAEESEEPKPTFTFTGNNTTFNLFGKNVQTQWGTEGDIRSTGGNLPSTWPDQPIGITASGETWSFVYPSGIGRGRLVTPRESGIAWLPESFEPMNVIQFNAVANSTTQAHLTTLSVTLPNDQYPSTKVYSLNSLLGDYSGGAFTTTMYQQSAEQLTAANYENAFKIAKDTLDDGSAAKPALTAMNTPNSVYTITTNLVRNVVIQPKEGDAYAYDTPSSPEDYGKVMAVITDLSDAQVLIVTQYGGPRLFGLSSGALLPTQSFTSPFQSEWEVCGVDQESRHTVDICFAQIDSSKPSTVLNVTFVTYQFTGVVAEILNTNSVFALDDASTSLLSAKWREAYHSGVE